MRSRSKILAFFHSSTPSVNRQPTKHAQEHRQLVLSFRVSQPSGPLHELIKVVVPRVSAASGLALVVHSLRSTTSAPFATRTSEDVETLR
jgi:hypothetical protein